MTKSKLMLGVLALALLSTVPAMAQGTSRADEIKARVAQIDAELMKPGLDFSFKMRYKHERDKLELEARSLGFQIGPDPSMPPRVTTQAPTPKPATPPAAAPAPNAAIPPGAAAPASKIGWVPVKDGKFPANAIVAGGNDGAPIRICGDRMHDGQVHPGKEHRGNCYIPFGDKELKSPVVAMLAGEGATWVPAKAGSPAPAGAVPSGGVSGGVPLNFCRAKMKDGQLHAGKEWRGRCSIGFGGREVHVAAYEVLTTGATQGGPVTSTPPGSAPAPTTATPPAAAAPASKIGWVPVKDGKFPADAIVAGGSAAAPIRICGNRMQDGQVHPGKEFRGNCYIPFGDKEMKSAVVAVLAGEGATWVAAKAGSPAPAGAVPSGGVAGGVPLNFCRAKLSDGQVHAGKEWRGRCYIGFGGKELQLESYEVLTSGMP